MILSSCTEHYRTDILSQSLLSPGPLCRITMDLVSTCTKKALIPAILPPKKCVVVESTPGTKDWSLGSLPFQLYFDRKCVFLWNRYRVPKIGKRNTNSYYSFIQIQLTTPLPQKMCSFVENVPGTAIQSKNFKHFHEVKNGSAHQSNRNHFLQSRFR